MVVINYKHLRYFWVVAREGGVTFSDATATADAFRDRFPRSLHRASALLPAADTALYSALRQWFQRPRYAPFTVP